MKNQLIKIKKRVVLWVKFPEQLFFTYSKLINQLKNKYPPKRSAPATTIKAINPIRVSNHRPTNLCIPVAQKIRNNARNSTVLAERPKPPTKFIIAGKQKSCKKPVLALRYPTSQTTIQAHIAAQMKLKIIPFINISFF